MNDYTQNPMYQQAVTKAMTYSPEQKAVLSSVAADENWASAEERKFINSMLRGAENKNRERSLSLQTKQFDTSMGLRQDALETSRLDARRALPISAANIGLSALTGWQEMKHQSRVEGIYNRLDKRLASLRGAA